YEGRAEFDEYTKSFGKLSASERAELIAFLSSMNPAEYEKQLKDLPANIRSVAEFYVPISKEQDAKIQRIQRKRLKDERSPLTHLRADQIVEDAGLDEKQAA